MAESVSELEILQALKDVRHPEIDHTLVDLGMLEDISVEGNKVVVTLKIPFLGIPIEVKNYLINSVRQAIANLDVNLMIEVNPAEMNPEERTKFMTMARERWLG